MIINNTKIALILLTIIIVGFLGLVTSTPAFASEQFYNSINDCTEKIPSYPEWNRIKCLSYFAAQDNNIEVCFDRYQDEKCFWAYAAWKKDASVCQSINQYLESDEVNQKRCYFEAALAAKDSSLCEANDKECKKAVGKISSYYIYLPILFILFFVSLISLFIFRKNTKYRMILAMFITLIPPAIVVFIRECLEFLKDFDFYFQSHKFGQLYLGFSKNFSDFDDMVFVFIFILLTLIYLPIVALIKSHQLYKIGDNTWKQFLIMFFVIHLFGIIVATFATAGYGLILALPLSGISALLSLIIFFISVNKIKQ